MLFVYKTPAYLHMYTTICSGFFCTDFDNKNNLNDCIYVYSFIDVVAIIHAYKSKKHSRCRDTRSAKSIETR